MKCKGYIRKIIAYTYCFEFEATSYEDADLKLEEAAENIDETIETIAKPDVWQWDYDYEVIED